MGHHQANTLAQKISNNIKFQLYERDTHMLAILQSILDLAQLSVNWDDNSVDQESYHHPTQVAASIALSSDRI